MRSYTERVEELFDAKSKAWSDKYREDAAFQHRLDRFARIVVARAPQRGAVLDFGCGTGEVAARLAEDGYVVTGVDIAEGMLAEARERHREAAQWRLLRRDWERLPFEDQSFDAIVASSVLEYVPRLDRLFAELGRIARPNATLAFTVPNESDPARRVEVLLRAVSTEIKPRVRRLLPGPVRRYFEYLDVSRNRFPLEVWTSLAVLAGFTPEEDAFERDGPLALLVFRRVPAKF